VIPVSPAPPQIVTGTPKTTESVVRPIKNDWQAHSPTSRLPSRMHVPHLGCETMLSLTSSSNGVSVRSAPPSVPHSLARDASRVPRCGLAREIGEYFFYVPFRRWFVCDCNHSTSTIARVVHSARRFTSMQMR